MADCGRRAPCRHVGGSPRIPVLRLGEMKWLIVAGEHLVVMLVAAVRV
jgi:hypothetical protein